MDVVSAGYQQMITQNNNVRFVHDAVMDYAEQLISTFPGNKLKRVFLVNSGLVTICEDTIDGMMGVINRVVL